MSILRRIHMWWLWRRAYKAIPGRTVEERGRNVMAFLDSLPE